MVVWRGERQDLFLIFFILWWAFIFFNFYFCNFYSVTVVCIFSPSLHPTTASPTSLPHLYPPPWFCPCVLYSSFYRPLSPLSPPHSPLVIVTMFLISMSLVIFCLLFSFVDYVPVKGEIIWYLESIMLREISQVVRDKYHMISPLTGT